MVWNRLNGFMDEPEERARAPDLWVVRSVSGCIYVSAQTAHMVLAKLGRLWRPRWLRFRDLSGSYIQVPTRSVLVVFESTAEQRVRDRELQQALDKEASEEERPW